MPVAPGQVRWTGPRGRWRATSPPACPGGSPAPGRGRIGWYPGTEAPLPRRGGRQRAGRSPAAQAHIAASGHAAQSGSDRQHGGAQVHQGVVPVGGLLGGSQGVRGCLEGRGRWVGVPSTRPRTRRALTSRAVTGMPNAVAATARAVYGPTPGKCIQGLPRRPAPGRRDARPGHGRLHAVRAPDADSPGRPMPGAHRRWSPRPGMATSGNRARKPGSASPTRAIWVCWDIVSASQMAYGSREATDGQRPSMRPYQATSASDSR